VVRHSKATGRAGGGAQAGVGEFGGFIGEGFTGGGHRLGVGFVGDVDDELAETSLRDELGVPEGILDRAVPLGAADDEDEAERGVAGDGEVGERSDVEEAGS